MIGNKEERFLIRTLMKDLGDVFVPSSFEEALQYFKVNPQPVMTAIIDERFEQRFSSHSIAQSTADISRSQMSTAEFIEEIKKMGILQPQTQYAVILADDRDSSHTLLYTEMGADVVLARPLGSQDLKTHFENFFQLVRNPPAAVRMMKFLRGLVEAKKFVDAQSALLKFLSLDPQNPHGQLLYAKTLLNLWPEKFVEGIEKLKLLDQKFPKSVLVKKLLREAFLKRELYTEAFRASERIYEQEPSRKHFDELIESAQFLYSLSLDHEVYLKIAEMIIPKGWVHKKREISVLWESWILGVVQEFKWEKMQSIVAALDKFFPNIYPEEIEAKKNIGMSLLKLLDSAAEFKTSPEWTLENEPYYVSFLGHLLDVDPTHGKAILELVEVTRKKESYKKIVWKRLENSLGGVGSISNLSQSTSTNGKGVGGKRGPIESYIAIARVGLDEGMLKEASDAIFIGKRLNPNDSRLEALSLEWRKTYDQKQQAA